ncbi:MAG: sulfotransferase [Gammaproteobacteria bacterium]|nr:sulfotransferase [Gammaproteobacteria bacterium]MDH5344360.1 sulfotransferase [Gammaproteobacteria bacterium]
MTEPGALLAKADALRKEGRIREAQRLCDQVLRAEPENVGALRIHAIIASDAEQFVIAEGFLKRIVRLAPDNPAAKFDLAKFLGERGRFAEAIALLEETAQAAGTNADVQLALGNMLAMVGRNAEAISAFDTCLRLRPGDAAALIGRGHSQRVEGFTEAARASYVECTKRWPKVGGAWWYLASLSDFEPTVDEIRTMRLQLDRDDLSPEAVAGFHFALARAFEGREDFEQAWAHYAAGNAAKRDTIDYDPVRKELDQRKIRQAFTREYFAGEPAQTRRDITPIFIVGMPRSGSTLVEQVLASHSRVEGCGELPYILTLEKQLQAMEPDNLHYTDSLHRLDVAELTRLGDGYIDAAATHRAGETPFFTDKMPANFPHVGLIHRILPHAKIIDARREPVATCVANYRQLFAQGKNHAYDLLEMGEYYLQYVETMKHWDEVLPGVVLKVQYEDVVADFEAEVRRILDFCGLPFEEGCLDFHKSDRAVNTASSEQVRQPLYTSAVEFWKNYEPYLDDLRDVLAPVLPA